MGPGGVLLHLLHRPGQPRRRRGQAFGAADEQSRARQDEPLRATDAEHGLQPMAPAVCTRCLPPTTRARSGCVLLAVLGIATIADGATQMACAPSIDVVCRDQEELVPGLLAQLAQLHTVSGLIGFAAPPAPCSSSAPPPS